MNLDNNKESYEDVSDLNGLVIPAIYEKLINNLSTIEDFVSKNINKKNPNNDIIKKYIKKINIPCKKISDYLIDKNGQSHNILARIEVDGNNIPLYNLYGIYVTGDHTVEKNNKELLRVKNHPDAKIIDNYKCSYLVCLITDTGYIPTINNIMFKDYLDTHHINKHRIVNKMIENELNNELSDNYNHSADIFSGLLLDDNVDIINKDDIIGNVEIGEWILNMYKLKNNDNTIYSANVLIEYNKKWIRMIEHPEAIYVGLNKLRLKHWISKTNMLILTNGITIRDFVEINDREITDKMNEFLLS
jgi:hypothetical protein